LITYLFCKPVPDEHSPGPHHPIYKWIKAEACITERQNFVNRFPSIIILIFFTLNPVIFEQIFHTAKSFHSKTALQAVLFLFQQRGSG